MFGMLFSCCCKKEKKQKKKKNSIQFQEDQNVSNSNSPALAPTQTAEIVFSSSSPIFTLHREPLESSWASSKDFHYYQVTCLAGLLLNLWGKFCWVVMSLSRWKLNIKYLYEVINMSGLYISSGILCTTSGFVFYPKIVLPGRIYFWECKLSIRARFTFYK